jgi:hypothetical protein
MQRFLAKFSEDASGCWMWNSHKNQKGYGLFWFGKKGISAHRLSYEVHVGPIPDGMQIDLLCRVPACVNPAHLEPVTPLENTRRGKKGDLHLACAQGHAMTPGNTLVHNTQRGVSRRCRTCQNKANRKYRERRSLMADQREADKLLATNREIT